jgi:hypothetical protein
MHANPVEKRRWISSSSSCIALFRFKLGTITVIMASALRRLAVSFA